MTAATVGDWSDRRIHFVGVGGAGMSGYARVVHALGATVSGSDARATPYSQALQDDGILRATVGYARENVPEGENVEVVYSSAVGPENPERACARDRGLPDRPRAQLLSELTALRPTIAVAGTHGKTTTSAMIVHALRAAGMKPGWMIGAQIGDGLANASWGEGRWLVVEADESDRSMLSLDVDIAVVTNLELDHHETYRTYGDLAETFRRFLHKARRGIVSHNDPNLVELLEDLKRQVEPETLEFHPQVAKPQSQPEEARTRTRSDTRESPLIGPNQTSFQHPPRSDPKLEAEGSQEIVLYEAIDVVLAQRESWFDWREHEVHLKVPGAHNASNGVAALEACAMAGADLDFAVAGLSEFRGAARRFELLGRTPEGATVIDDYAHHPTEVAATLAAARSSENRRLVAVFQPHLFSRTASFTSEFGAALAIADVAVVLEIYPARERAEDHPGVSGIQIARATADASGGRPVYWLATIEAAGPVLAGMLSEGDICVVMGAGDIDRLGHMLIAGDRGGMTADREPVAIRRDVSMADLTTVGTGGRAQRFARAGTREHLRSLIAWALAVGLELRVVGSGSNLLASDEGVDGLVVKLDGDLARVEREGPRLICGAAARLPAVAARAAREGLAGLEFGVNIPGTVGGAVRMNANAYGGRLADTLEWVDVADREGIRRLAQPELGLRYRGSDLRDGEVVIGASFHLHGQEPAAVRKRLAELRDRRHAAQPQGIRTFGSTFKNPDDPLAPGQTAGCLLALSGCSEIRVGDARFSTKHANFIENLGAATTTQIVVAMHQARSRVLSEFGVALTPEVQTLGPVTFTWL